MLEVIIENYRPISKILLYSIFFIAVFVLIFYKLFKEHIKANWTTYRANPLFMPFAGFLNPEKGMSGLKSTIKNFTKVLWNMVKRFLAILMTPVYPILKIFMKIFKALTGVLDGLRNQINVIRNFLFKLFEKMYIKLQNGTATIAFFFLKLRESMKRSYGLMNVLIYAIEHSFLFFESMVKSPLGKFGQLADTMGVGASIFTFGGLGIPMWHGAMCFAPNTMLALNSQTLVKIKDVCIGDVLQNDNTVLATMYLNNPTNLYMIDNIIVSGDHLLKMEQRWERVENIPRAVKVPFDVVDRIVCLVTSHGIIEINNLVFKDYLDSHDLEVNKVVRQLVENNLNNTINHINRGVRGGCVDLLYGFHPDTNIINSDDVVGEVKIAAGILEVFKYRDTLLSGNILVYCRKSWRRVVDLEEATPLGKNKVPFVHFITNTNTLNLRTCVIRDFCESNNPWLNDKIDLFVENTINN